MGLPGGFPVVVFLFLSGTMTAGLAIFAWRQGSVPGRNPLIGLLVTVTVWTLGYGFGLLTTDPDLRLLWGILQWLVIPFVPVFWLLFALAYTGWDEYVTLKTTVLLSILPAGTTVMALTNGWFGLMWNNYTIHVADGLALVTYDFGPWLILNVLYGYALVLAGMILILRLIVFYESLYADQAISLAVGVFVPWVANFLVMQRMVPVEGIDYTPFAFAITGIAFSNAMFRHRLLRFLPVVQLIGREAAMDDLTTGVVILDDEDTAVYLNPTAIEILDRARSQVVGRPVDELLDPTVVDIGSPNTTAELSLSGQTFEVRSSPVTNRHGTEVGRTVVLTDVTSRKQRERELQQQRDELEWVTQINSVIREINDTLVNASSRDEIEDVVCERLTRSTLYEDAWIGRGVLTDGGEFEWTSGGRENPPSIAADLDATMFQHSEEKSDTAVSSTENADHSEIPTPGSSEWTSIPVAHGRTVYGLLMVFSSRQDAFGSRERAVLEELGVKIGHAIKAIENHSLLQSDRRLELEFLCEDDASSLVQLSAAIGCRGEMIGLVPRTDDRFVVYFRIERSTESSTRDLARDLPGVTAARTISSSENDEIVELVLDGGSLVFPLATFNITVQSIHLDAGSCRVVVEAPPGIDVRMVTERIRQDYPNTDLLAKRTTEPTIDNATAAVSMSGGELTDRQAEVLEAAYRAGYFEWPRESTAEEVAAALDISPPTLHGHIRKSQSKLLEELLGERRTR